VRVACQRGQPGQRWAAPAQRAPVSSLIELTPGMVGGRVGCRGADLCSSAGTARREDARAGACGAGRDDGISAFWPARTPESRAQTLAASCSHPSSPLRHTITEARPSLVVRSARLSLWTR
jgi:hypothetical protein